MPNHSARRRGCRLPHQKRCLGVLASFSGNVQSAEAPEAAGFFLMAMEVDAL